MQLLLNIGLDTAFTLTATTAVPAGLVLKDRHTPVLLLSSSSSISDSNSLNSSTC
jgi:hypothetical protein